jgi:hypothetical protein
MRARPDPSRTEASAQSSDGRQRSGDLRLVAQAPADFGKTFELPVDAVGATLLLDDAHDAQIAPLANGSLLLEE